MFRRKLYWLLFTPSILVFLILLIILPEEKRNYTIFVPAVFWVFYYSIIKFIDLKSKKRNETSAF